MKRFNIVFVFLATSLLIIPTFSLADEYFISMRLECVDRNGGRSGSETHDVTSRVSCAHANSLMGEWIDSKPCKRKSLSGTIIRESNGKKTYLNSQKSQCNFTKTLKPNPIQKRPNKKLLSVKDYIKSILDSKPHTRTEFKDFLDYRDFKSIRFLYDSYHGDFARSELRKLNNEQLVEALRKVGIIMNADYLPIPAPASDTLRKHIEWCVTHEQVRIFEVRGFRMVKPERLRKACSKAQNGSAKKIVNDASSSEVYGAMKAIHNKYRRHTSFRDEHFDWVMNTKAKKEEFIEAYNNFDYLKLLAIFFHATKS